jgi:CheY-like chemotaxis protein
MTYSVLIVDDNASLANLYQIVFERIGCRVRRVTNGQEALRYIAEDIPDVVLLDFMMPEMDGVEVCRRIRVDWPQQPPAIAIYTANTRAEVREKCLAAGADMFFTKSLSVFDLPEHLASSLSSLPPTKII